MHVRQKRECVNCVYIIMILHACVHVLVGDCFGCANVSACICMHAFM